MKFIIISSMNLSTISPKFIGGLCRVYASYIWAIIGFPNDFLAYAASRSYLNRD